MTLEGILENLSFNNITIQEAKDKLQEKDKKKLINYFLHKDKINNEPLKDGELSQLIALVEILQILYNSSVDSPISDDDYDTLQEMLVNMGIPRLTGSIEINSANKVNHQYTNLRGSINKFYYLYPHEKRTNKSRKYLHELIKWMESKYEKNTGKKINLEEAKVLLQPKFDGASCTLEASSDKKMKWVTRGDTGVNKASDVSHIMNIFNNLYRGVSSFIDIDYLGGVKNEEFINEVIGDFGIKFEVMMTEDNKEKINKLYRDRPYKNSRQIVTATLNSNEADFKADYLYPIPLRIMKKGDKTEQIHPDLVNNFPTKVCKLSDRDIIKEFANENRWVLRNGMRFRTDGVVLTILDPKLQEALGRENNMNNFEIAYKTTEECAYSKVRDVEFYVSEFGFITPVLVVNPVILKGNTIDHISLSNKERFDELFFAYGDDVKVLYDIIPYATRDEKCNRVKNGRKIEFVPQCPKCREELEFTEMVLNKETQQMERRNLVQIQCKNKNCPARLIGRILNYCKNLRIQNIGYQTLDTLHCMGLLKKGIRSLYKLKKKTVEIEALEGFGRLKTRKIIAEIESKRRLKDYEFFGSIGIENLSMKTFQSIFNQIRYGSFMEMMNLKNFDSMLSQLLEIEGMGDKKSEALVDYLKSNENRLEIQKLLEELSIYETYQESSISKGRIVFSGCRPTSEEEEILKSHGWEVSDTWSNKAKYLVVPSADYESGKVANAKTAGVPIIHTGSQMILPTLKQVIPKLLRV